MDIKSCIVLCTTPNRETAQQIATELVKEKCAACANVIPQVQSIFQWDGKQEVENESLMVIKTQVTAYPRLEKLILELHPYECPEIISLPIFQGFEGYLTWMEESISEA